MANRLTRITTRSGDDGTTGLADGSRLAKDSSRIEAIGALDELNSALGVVALHVDTGAEGGELLRRIQNRLFDLGGELALPGTEVLGEAQVARLEQAIETLNADLPPLEEFVLPGGGHGAAYCHQARAICRRAERELWRLSRSEPLNPNSRKYLNRLSDLLFVLARTLARQDGGSEITWQRHDPT